MKTTRPGRIITFYSYKGGTGRSMALANLAWVLATSRKRVLMMDWDLEAPGLHRYFHPFLADKELVSARGLVDLLTDYADLAIQPPAEGEGEEWYRELTDLTPYLQGVNFTGFPEGGRLDLLPAGRQGPSYAARLQGFDWDSFYEHLGGGGFLEAVKARLRQDYDYVLIDSRTGVSDTAGICTVQMPDVLVAMYTYNNQSIRGCLAVAQSSAEARLKLYGQVSGEPFRVFPVPSRADPFELRKLQMRQAYARKLFAPLLEHLPVLEHASYWAGVEVPYSPILSYEEVLSPLLFSADDPKLPLASVLRLASHVTDGEVTRYDLPLSPEDRQALLLAYEQVDEGSASTEPAVTNATASTPEESPAEALLRAAETVLAKMNEAELNQASCLLLRLVRLPKGQETAGLKRLVAAVSDLLPEELPILERLVKAGAIKVKLDEGGQRRLVEIADDALLVRWRQLNEWADREKAFLERRDWIQTGLENWLRGERDDSLLLPATLAEQASRLLATHAPLLSQLEIDYIKQSRDYRRAKPAAEPTPKSMPAPQARTIRPVFLVAGLAAVALAVYALYPGDSGSPVPPPVSVGQPPPPASNPPEVQPPPDASPGGNSTAFGFYFAGNQDLAEKRLDAALKKFDLALQLNPDYRDAYLSRAEAYQQKGDLKAASADLETAIRLAPDEPMAYLNLARLKAEDKSRTKAQSKEQAIDLYKRVLALNPGEEIRVRAEKELDKLSPAPAVPKVYLHINAKEDQGFADLLGKTLSGQKMRVQETQILPQSTSADVRYANSSDEDTAKRIQSMVQDLLRKEGYRQRVELLFIGNKFQNVPRGTIEIWLPLLNPPQQAIAPPEQMQLKLPKASR